ncbi:MAG: GNAT family N-acetyltransferase [Proteobacteria bacterium]|jgi:GNAT superfamily N-acetyltransferase|nr:GNAT family N-acetyltransferase [Pseudomonadota bacterium]
MTSIACSVGEIDRKDAEQVARVLTDALWDLPSMRFAFEGVPEDAIRRRFRRGLSSVTLGALSFGRVLAARADGEIQGAAIAYPPGAWPLPFFRWVRSGLGFLTIGPKPFVRLARYDGILSRLHPAQPHWYLYFLGVPPERQGRGLGRALFSRLAEIAAADRVPMCLETDKESNVGFYAANGCVVTATHDLQGIGGIRLWQMRSEPSSTTTAE